ncbi:MAG: DUF2793 domain-containing protein [Pseudomonadota bacterium]
MEKTELLQLPYIMEAQAQKHVTHNEAIRMLDALLHLSAVSRSALSPPAEPAPGTRYLIPNGALGDWESRGDQIAVFQDGAWEYFQPGSGWKLWLEDEATPLVFDGTVWAPLVDPDYDNLPSVGVNTQADPTNRLAVKSPAVLFSHDDSSQSEDMRLVLNKFAPSATASIIFQSAFTGHAEFGLAGNNDFLLKVSDGNGNWFNAIEARHTDGAVFVPHAQPSSVTRSNMDTNGLFTTVENYRPDGSLWRRSVLSGGQSPEYAQRDLSVFDATGSTSVAQYTFDLTYANGVLVEETVR